MGRRHGVTPSAQLVSSHRGTHLPSFQPPRPPVASLVVPSVGSGSVQSQAHHDPATPVLARPGLLNRPLLSRVPPNTASPSTDALAARRPPPPRRARRNHANRVAEDLLAVVAVVHSRLEAGRRRGPPPRGLGWFVPSPTTPPRALRSCPTPPLALSAASRGPQQPPPTRHRSGRRPRRVPADVGELHTARGGQPWTRPGASRNGADDCIPTARRRGWRQRRRERRARSGGGG